MTGIRYYIIFLLLGLISIAFVVFLNELIQYGNIKSIFYEKRDIHTQFGLGLLLSIFIYGIIKKVKIGYNLILSVLILIVQLLISNYLLMFFKGLDYSHATGQEINIRSTLFIAIYTIGQSMNFLLWHLILRWNRITHANNT